MPDLEDLKPTELIDLYSQIIKMLKERGIIRSKNIIGDLGEYLAIEHYCNTPNLPKLQQAPTNTQNVDALSTKGERYSIKASSSRLTGVFYGLNPPDSTGPEIQKFEFVIVVVFDDDFKLLKILELDWDMFLKFKKWHKTMRAWNLSITKELIESAKIVYDNRND